MSSCLNCLGISWGELICSSAHPEASQHPRPDLTAGPAPLAQATVHAMLSARLRAAAEEAAAPLPAAVTRFGKASVAYGAALVAALVRC